MVAQTDYDESVTFTALAGNPVGYTGKTDETYKNLFDGPCMFVAAAEGDGDMINGRGDAYCGMLNCSYNLGMRHLKGYIPCYRDFILAKCRSLSFASTPTDCAPCSGSLSLRLRELRQILLVDRRIGVAQQHFRLL